MKPAHQMEMLHKPHVYTTRKLANGVTVSGYEPAPEPVQPPVLPSAADLDAVAEELKAKEQTIAWDMASQTAVTLDKAGNPTPVKTA
jgi:hypothetical protein